MEDDLGVMWIGTSEGLVHYDGFWLNTLNSKWSLAPDRSMVHQDVNGLVWGMNFSGEVFCSDYEHTWKDTLVSNYFTDRIIMLQQQQQDSLLFVTKKELVLHVPSTGETTVIFHTEPNDFIYSAAGMNYIQTSHGILSTSSGNLIPFTHREAYNLTFCEAGAFAHVMVEGEAYSLQGNEAKPLVKDLKDTSGKYPRINGVRSTSSGTWVLTYSGAYLVEKQQWMFPGEPISDIVETRDGATWFSTLTDGIRVVPNMNVKRFAKVPDGLPTERFNRIGLMENSNIVATDNSGKIVRINQNDLSWKAIQVGSPMESEMLHIDSANHRILAAFGALYLLDTNLTVMDRLEGNFKSVVVDRDTLRTILGTNLFTVDYKNNRFGEIRPVDPTEPSFNYQLFKDSQNSFWSVSNKGVTLNGRGISDNRAFRTGCADGNGTVFLSDRSDSIAVYSGAQLSKWLTIPRESHMETAVRQLVATENHLLVLLSNAMIVYDRKTEVWIRLGASEGIPTTDLRDALIADGIIWLATFNGIYALPIPKENQPVPPRVMLRRLTVNDVEYPATAQLSLAHDQNDIELILRGISIRSRGQLRFRYDLEGVTDGYEENSTGNVLRFRSLSPGNYNLSVVAVDANGNSSQVPLKLTFRIKAPWYTTWPFILGLGLLLTAITSSVFLLRIRYINSRNARLLENSRLKEDLRHSQLTAIRAQMNPHFLFNVLNSVQGLFTIGKAEKANEVLSSFSELMRAVLDASDENMILLSRELSLIRVYIELEAVRFGEDFQFDIAVDGKIDPEQINVPSLLIQPYVENAVKHGLLHRRGKKRLRVEFRLSEDEKLLEVQIEDNGIGRKAAGELRSRKHRSFATRATTSRLELLNLEHEAKIGVLITDRKDENGNGIGTLVELRIPIK